MVCRAVAQYQRQVKSRLLIVLFPYEALAQATGECEKVCYRAMERADKHGLLEYGVSLRTAWLTAAGRELLDVPKPKVSP